jgi:opacity protein-like surface antigen
MKLLVKNAFVGLCVCASLLLISSPSLRAQVLAHSGEVAGFGGDAHLGDGGGNSPIYGGSGGYNIMPAVTLFGEYSYISLPKIDCGPDTSYDGPDGCTASDHAQSYGGGVRFNFLTSKRVVPYGVFAFDGARSSVSAAGVGSNSVNGWDVGFGGGASFYVAHNWGVRPEYRYERIEFHSNGNNTNLITGGVFFQWGGRAVKK